MYIKSLKKNTIYYRLLYSIYTISTYKEIKKQENNDKTIDDYDYNDF